MSPVADTVWTSTRSTRRAMRVLVPAARASGTSAVAAGRDLRRVRGPVDEDPQRRDHDGDLGDHGHRAADELQPLAGDARGAPGSVWWADGSPTSSAATTAAATAGTAGTPIGQGEAGPDQPP